MKGRARSALPKPVRPHIPLIARASISFWAACACTYHVSRYSDSVVLRYLFAISALSAIALLVATLKMRSAGITMIAAAVAVGCLIGAARSYVLIESAQGISEHAVNGAECALLQDPRKGTYGYTCLAQVSLHEGLSCKARIHLQDADELLCGSAIRLTSSHVIDVGSSSDSLWQSGAAVAISVKSYEPLKLEGPVESVIAVRKRAIDAIRSSNIGYEEKMLLQALCCGWRMDLSASEVYSAFKSCGLAHIVAVSGAHLVIVTGLATALFRKARVPRKLSIAMLVATMVVYFILAGEPISALRACVMSMLALFAYFGKRRPSALNAIGIAMVVLIAIEPESCVSVSFALSCLSTLGIALFAPLFAYAIGKTPLERFGLVIDVLALTLSALVATQPISCALFSQLPLIAPVANILIAPLFPIACAGALAAGFLSITVPAIAGAVCAAAAIPVRILSIAATAIAKIPFACIPVYIPIGIAIAVTAATVGAIYGLWLLHPGRYKVPASIGSAILIVGALSFGMKPDRIVMLDVGQGDAFLICSKGATMLIDTGNQDTMLLAALGRQGIAHIDAVLITHADDDHCGSLDALEACVEVDVVLLSDRVLSSCEEKSQDLVTQAEKTARNIERIEFGDRIDIGNFTARVVWPHPDSNLDENASSICLIADYDAEDDGESDIKALFTGDAENEELECIMDEQGLNGADILKVSHHGSRNGTTEALAERISPDIALISVGEHNRYGHPTREAIDALDDAGCVVYRTDINGDVSCIMGSAGIAVQTQR